MSKYLCQNSTHPSSVEKQRPSLVHLDHDFILSNEQRFAAYLTFTGNPRNRRNTHPRNSLTDGDPVTHLEVLSRNDASLWKQAKREEYYARTLDLDGSARETKGNEMQVGLRHQV